MPGKNIVHSWDVESYYINNLNQRWYENYVSMNSREHKLVTFTHHIYDISD